MVGSPHDELRIMDVLPHAARRLIARVLSMIKSFLGGSFSAPKRTMARYVGEVQFHDKDTKDTTFSVTLYALPYVIHIGEDDKVHGSLAVFTVQTDEKIPHVVIYDEDHEVRATTAVSIADMTTKDIKVLVGAPVPTRRIYIAPIRVMDDDEGDVVGYEIALMAGDANTIIDEAKIMRRSTWRGSA